METNHMNEPIAKDITDTDICCDYAAYKDKKIVARRYCIPVSEVTKILKRNSLL